MPEAKKQKPWRDEAAADTELLIPDWCPKQIGDKARELHRLHSGSPIAVAVIERLTTDRRMRRVWDELTKERRENHRRTGKPLHKLAGKFDFIGHDSAVAGLFEFAANIGRLTLALPTPDHPDRPFQALADRLKEEAKRLGNDRISKKITKQLLMVAENCEATILAAYNPEKNIAVEVAYWLDTVFGSPKYKTTAIITGVITGRAITDRKVRTWIGR